EFGSRGVALLEVGAAEPRHGGRNSLRGVIRNAHSEFDATKLSNGQGEFAVPCCDLDRVVLKQHFYRAVVRKANLDSGAFGLGGRLFSLVLTRGCVDEE